MLHVTPSWFRKGDWLAQVPLNSPFFKKMSRTDIPMKNNNTIPIDNNTVAITFYLCAKIRMYGHNAQAF